MLPFSEKVRRMNAARAAMQAQHEAGASAAPTTNSPAAANQEAPTEPNSQVAASPSAAVDRRSHEDKRTVSYVRKRDVIVQELLSQRKSLASPEQTPVPVPAAAAAARLPQEQLVAGMRSRIYLNSIASRRFTSYKAEELSARVSPIAAETAGGRAGQKRKQSPLTAAPASKYFDKDLHGEDTNTVSVLDSDDGEEKEEEEEEEVVEDSRQRRQQLQRHERQETHPSKRTKKTSRQKSSMTTPPGTTNGTVLDVFDKAFATRIKIEEKNTEAAILKDEENQEEEKEEEDALQTAGVPHTTLMNTIPLLHPPPPSEYRLRFDESGNEIPLTGISSEVEVEEEAYLDLAVPGSIAKYLRPYQQAGVKFLLKNYARGNGALLADDMGLGKTLQAIAFLSAVLGKSGDPRVDKDSPKLPQFERLKRNVDTDTTGNTQEDGNTPPTKSTATGIDLSDDFYEPDYRFGAPILIVCPTSLIDNWAAEFLKWGTFRVIKLRSNAIDTGVARLLAGDAEVGIASYDGIRNTSEKFSKVPWHVVVFDEAHKLKNPKAGQTEAAARLPTRLRFALTGTPMANDYEELFNVLNFVVPGKLGTSHQFKDNISTKIKYGMRKGATEEEIEEGNSAQIKLQELLRPFMLRRLKSIIAHEMPKKKDNVVFCQLAPLQMKAYKRALQLPDVKLLILKAQDPCPCGLSGDSVKKCMHADCPGYYKLHYNQGGLLYPHFHFCECDNVYDPISNPTGCKYHNPDGCWRFFQGQRHRACPYCLVLPLMMILKKIALHLDLIKANPEDEKIDPVKFAWQKEVADAILGTDAVAVGGNVQTLRHMDMSNIAASCGKIAALKVLLAKWAADVRGSGGLPHKVLVFSNSVRMLKIVRKMAENAGYSHEYLTGETPQADRQKIVNSFNAPNSKAFLFFVSTEAGGVGLNLTAANKVVILDPSYSPAADLQAMDRAFRIGQKRDVDVYRLVAAGTVEERIYMRQISKQQHINVAVDGSAHQKRLFVRIIIIIL
jgi:SNF2 family DNA or RNA helicase